jgi:hypothetical protein
LSRDITRASQRPGGEKMLSPRPIHIQKSDNNDWPEPARRVLIEHNKFKI